MLRKALIIACVGAGLLLVYSVSPFFKAAGKASAGHGELLIEPLILVSPLEKDSEFNRIKARNPWFFPGWSRDEVSLFLEEALLPEPLRTDLLEKIEVFPPIHGCVIMPSDDEVLALSPDARAWIYNHLSLFNINKDQACAGRYTSGSMAERMEKIGASDETVATMESLAYRNGSLLFFADLPLLLDRIDDPAERQAVYSNLREVETLRLGLRISGRTVLTELTTYWGAGGYQDDVRPLLEAAQAEGTVLDVAGLLPPIPGQLLYQFPVEADMERGSENCHWTAVNFFSSFENAVPSDAESVQDFIMNECSRITKDQLRFGDIIVYLRDVGDGFEVVHSAVFIADDVVYTKNGVTWFSPWIFMRTGHMDDYYNYGVPLRKIYIRRKG